MKHLKPLPRLQLSSEMRFSAQELVLQADADQRKQLRRILCTRRNHADGSSIESFLHESQVSDDVTMPLGLVQIVGAVTGQRLSTTISPWSISEQSLGEGYLSDGIAPGALELVGRKRRGLIVVEDAKSQAKVIAQIIAAFPDSRMALVSGSRTQIEADLYRVRRHLSPRLQSQVTTIRGAVENTQTRRVFFATVSDLQQFHCRPEDPPELIVLTPSTHILQDWVPQALCSFPRARLFGIALLDESKSSFERDWEQAFFGVDEVTILRDGRAAPQFFSHIEHIRPRRSLDPSTSGRELRDKGIVGHRARNQIIMEAANGSSKVSTVVVAHDLQHAVNLALLDDRWRILRRATHVPSWISGEGRGVIARRVERTMSDPNRAIVPLTELNDGQSGRFGVIIYAAGTAGVSEDFRRLAITGNWNRSRPCKLLVDFRDHHHPMLCKDSFRREECYRRWGIPSASMTAKDALIAEFLARRGFAYEPD